MTTSWIVAFSFFLLGACGFEEAPETVRAGSPAISDRTPFITGAASGAVTSEFALSGAFKCEHNGFETVAEMIGTGAGSVEQLAITVPYALAGVGAHALIGSADNPTMSAGRFEIRYRTADRKAYNRGSGTLTITQWPENSGGTVSGTVRATLSDGQAPVEIEAVVSGAVLIGEFDCHD